MLFAANDAFLRDYRLVVPADYVASQNADENRRALAQIKHMLDADMRTSSRLDLPRLVAGAGAAEPDERN